MAIFLHSHFAIVRNNATDTPPLLEVPLPNFSNKNSSSSPFYFMGGGPRTYPGGVTKWQWKRMQLKKARQIEKARLLREKHVYEARRRAELLSASPVLEMPWERMSRVRPPNFVSADEHITKLAARFQKEGAEDLWTEKDGPEKFERLEQNPISSSQHEFVTKDSQDIDSFNSSTTSRNVHSGANNRSQTSFQSFRKMPQTTISSNPFVVSQSEAYE